MISLHFSQITYSLQFVGHWDMLASVRISLCNQRNFDGEKGDEHLMTIYGWNFNFTILRAFFLCNLSLRFRTSDNV